jgi:hypothetical protein
MTESLHDESARLAEAADAFCDNLSEAALAAIHANDNDSGLFELLALACVDFEAARDAASHAGKVKALLKAAKTVLLADSRNEAHQVMDLLDEAVEAFGEGV